MNELHYYQKPGKLGKAGAHSRRHKGGGMTITLQNRLWLFSEAYNRLIQGRDRRAAWKAGQSFSRRRNRILWETLERICSK